MSSLKELCTNKMIELNQEDQIEKFDWINLELNENTPLNHCKVCEKKFFREDSPKFDLEALDEYMRRSTMASVRNLNKGKLIIFYNGLLICSL